MCDIEDLACASCGKPAKLQCPKCLTLGLPKDASAFCTQDCFKGAWGEHKKCHKQKNDDEWQYACERGGGRVKSMPNWSWTGTLRPYPIGKMRTVPAGVECPDWAKTGYPLEESQSRFQQSAPVRTPAEIEKMRAACLLGRKMLDLAHAHVKPGVTTDEIDRVVHEATVAAGAYPSPLNYHNFPKSCCTSVNEVICHGIPDQRPLEEGDIVNVDISLMIGGNHADLNETFVVGEVDDDSKHLIKSTYECLQKSIEMCRPGVRFRDIGQTISKVAQNAGLSVVKSYCGHGIGELFHCAPNMYGTSIIRKISLPRDFNHSQNLAPPGLQSFSKYGWNSGHLP